MATTSSTWPSLMVLLRSLQPPERPDELLAVRGAVVHERDDLHALPVVRIVVRLAPFAGAHHLQGVGGVIVVDGLAVPLDVARLVGIRAESSVRNE